MLNERAATVLNILVNRYVNTATPVASEDIARMPAVQLSSATIRNTMSQLTEEGFISRPHVSSGGIPSDLGYRHYVETLPDTATLSGRLRRQVDQDLAQSEPDVDSWSHRCAAILSKITANLAIVTAPRAASPRLKRIQLVFLQDFTALLVIVLEEARLLKRLLALEERLDQLALDRVALKLNESLAGLNQAEIASPRRGWASRFGPLEERIREDSLSLMRESETADAAEHYTEGLSHLLNQPEFSPGERARQLVQMVEERVLLERILSAGSGGSPLSIFIGSENQDESLSDFGVIVCQYGVPGQVGGTICVVGPKRMGYRQAIGGARHLSDFMSHMLQDLHGGAFATRG